MKSYTLKTFTYLLLSAFVMAGVPSFAITTTANASTTMEYSSATTTGGSHVVKQKTQKRGFFAKVKNFGKKVKMALDVMAGGGEHNAFVAIVLAFFLGGLGLHRVYLGGRPILILFYIITFGGIFGLLPLIDFIRLIIGQMDHYEGNDKFLAAFSSAK